MTGDPLVTPNERAMKQGPPSKSRRNPAALAAGVLEANSPLVSGGACVEACCVGPSKTTSLAAIRALAPLASLATISKEYRPALHGLPEVSASPEPRSEKTRPSGRPGSARSTRPLGLPESLNGGKSATKFFPTVASPKVRRSCGACGPEGAVSVFGSG